MPIANDITQADIERYFLGCFVTNRRTREVFKVESAEAGKVYLRSFDDRTSVSFINFPIEYDLNIPELGYFPLGDTVVYVSNKQNNSPIKSLHKSNVTIFLPQEAEYRALKKSMPRFSMDMVFDRPITPLESVTEALETKDAVVVHKNFAIVKKGFCENPVVYHRTHPAAMWVDNTAVPFDKSEQVYVDKLLLEIQRGD